MNFIKRAFLSLTRRSGKSFILLLIVFILSNIMAGSIAISQASKNVEKTMKTQLGADATIELDYNKTQKWTDTDWNSMEMISPDMVEKVGKLPQVKYYDYNTETWLLAPDLKNYDLNMVEPSEYNYFSLRGVQFKDVLDIAKGDATLVEGRTFTQDEIDTGKAVGLVSDKMAELNNLHIGDLMVFNNTYYEPDGTVTERSVMIEIIGLFSPKIEQQNNSPKLMAGSWIDYSPFNRVYVPNKIPQAEMDWQNMKYMEDYPDANIKVGQIYITPTFVLNNPEETETFKKEAQAFIPDYYKVRADSDAYDAVAGPITFIGSLSKTILYVAIGATILILGLVVILFLRDRKHELGIYLSLGERKWKILSQIVLEVVTVALVAITLSLVSGSSIAKATSQSMINMGVGATNSEDGMVYPYYDPNAITQEDVLNAYSISFNLDYVLVLYGVGLSTVLVSTIAPMIYILRLKPKKIMM